MSLECTACPDNILLSPFSIAGLLSGLSWFVYALCLISSWRTDMYPVCYESKLSFLFLFLSWHRKKYRYKIKEGFLRNRISDYSRNGIFRQPKNVLGSHSSRPQRYCWFFFLSLNFHELDWHGAYEVCPPMPLKGILKIHQFNKALGQGKGVYISAHFPVLGGF